MKKYLSILLIAVLVVTASCGDDKVQTIYTVTFQTDGGTPVPPSQKIDAGKTVSVPSTNPSKVGYVFLFWHLDGASVAYQFSTPVSKDFTLYAKWEEEAKVEYWNVAWELNGGAWPSDDNHAAQVVKGGTLAEPAAPVKTGAAFEGWYKEAAFTNKIAFPYDVSGVTGNITLFAKWNNEDPGGDPSANKVFTSIAALKTWLASQPENSLETAYKVVLKNVNLDEGNNWNDLGLAIKGSKFLELDLQNCSGTTIPDGYSQISGTPPSVTITYAGTFLNCDNLVSIHLPTGLKTIGEYAFRGCDNLATVNLPQGLLNINSRAFEYCIKLASIALPEGLKKIGGHAFQYSGLTVITIPGSVDEWVFAFYRCSSLTSAVVREGIQAIPKEAFWECSSLTSVVLPASLKTITDDAFFRCVLETVTLPQGLTAIGKSAFEHCDFESIVFPQGLSTIGAHAFSSNVNLKAIQIPSSVKTVGSYAFSNCASLTSAHISDGVQYLNDHVFVHCKKLTDVSLPKNLNQITASLFEWCESLATITVPASVATINNDAFFNCKSLVELIMLPVTPPSLGNSALIGTPASISIKVPAASLDAYKDAWNSYSGKIVANTD